MKRMRGFAENILLGCIAVLLISFLSYWGYAAHRTSSLKLSLAETQKAHSEYVAKAQAQATAESEAARKRQAELQAAADDSRRLHDEATTTLAAERDAALARLRSRQTRAAATAAAQADPATSGGEVKICTGAELQRDDAEFLTREAARADQLKLDYDELWSVYSKARAQELESGNAARN